MRLKKVYRVRLTCERTYGGQKQAYDRTRHFFSKHNAERNYKRFQKAIENSGVKGHSADIPYWWGKPVKVQFSESQPLVFMDDEEGLF